MEAARATFTMSANPNSRARQASVGRQGAWLLSGFGAAQACAFARNAILGHALSKGDFGVAAMLTLMLQVVETLSDLGSDRLIVQAVDGGRRRFVAAAHFVLVARGLLLGAILLAVGPAVARFFGAPHAAVAFQLMAFAPLIKGFSHLDFRRAQRRFDNRPFMALEALPQMAALALTFPALALAPDFLTVAWLAIAQAIAAVILSHFIARRAYLLIFDLDLLKRHLAFGWPILASALPLIAVYHGDRMIIGRLQGLEAVAGFTAAFMVTMAPGVIAAKVCHALMLPMFSSAQRKGRGFDRSFFEMTELAVVAAALYLAAFVIAGERLLPIVFGSNYSDLGAVTAWLAAMWSLRIVQAVAGMALMSTGATKPFLVAGIIRAHALPCVLLCGVSRSKPCDAGGDRRGVRIAFASLRRDARRVSGTRVWSRLRDASRISFPSGRACGSRGRRQRSERGSDGVDRSDRGHGRVGRVTPRHAAAESKCARFSGAQNSAVDEPAT